MTLCVVTTVTGILGLLDGMQQRSGSPEIAEECGDQGACVLYVHLIESNDRNQKSVLHGSEMTS